MTDQPTAERFVERLMAMRSADEAEKVKRYFKTGEGEYAEGDRFAGVAFRDVFALAREFIEMTPAEIEKLLDSPIHEVRAGALSIMDKQARRKRTGEDRRRELYELYLRRTDRIDNWDLVDVCAPHVVGGYLAERPRDVLYGLARSENIWERRAAIVSTAYLIRRGELDDTFAIARILRSDDHDMVQKAVGGWLREAGKREPERLREFLDENAPEMGSTALRYATEKLDRAERDRYRALGRAARR